MLKYRSFKIRLLFGIIVLIIFLITNSIVTKCNKEKMQLFDSSDINERIIDCSRSGTQPHVQLRSIGLVSIRAYYDMENGEKCWLNAFLNANDSLIKPPYSDSIWVVTKDRIKVGFIIRRYD